MTSPSPACRRSSLAQPPPSAGSGAIREIEAAVGRLTGWAGKGGLRFGAAAWDGKGSASRSWSLDGGGGQTGRRRCRSPYQRTRFVPLILVFKIGRGGAAVEDGKEEVIQAWYMDDSEEDQRLHNHREPKEFIPLNKLSELDVVCWRLNADDWERDENLKKIREARGYSYVDICDVCPEKLPNYKVKIKNFFEEHLHTGEEIRYCLEGSGYFDLRAENEQWIRVAVKKGGMIVLPAGMYHRFTLDSDNYIKVGCCLLSTGVPSLTTTHLQVQVELRSDG
ncbi:hypothetical protein ACQ4PT_022291 [Festuca glaucescens]